MLAKTSTGDDSNNARHNSAPPLRKIEDSTTAGQLDFNRVPKGIKADQGSNSMQMQSIRILFIAAAMVTVNAARAQNVEAGKHIAQTWCSACHRIAAEGQKTGNDAVPSFSSIAQEKSTTSISLAAFLSTPHPHMPNYVLSRTEMRDVSAYILSLRMAH